MELLGICITTLLRWVRLPYFFNFGCSADMVWSWGRYFEIWFQKSRVSRLILVLPFVYYTHINENEPRGRINTLREQREENEGSAPTCPRENPCHPFHSVFTLLFSLRERRGVCLGLRVVGFRA